MFSFESLFSYEAFTLNIFLLIMLPILGILFFRSQAAKEMNRNVLGIVIAVYGIILAILVYRAIVPLLMYYLLRALFGWWQ